MVEQSERASKEEGRDPPPDHLATAHLRQLPDFVIIGAQRGGTTSLFRYLSEHPDVGRPIRKEVRFFDQYFDRGADWYRAHFPLRGETPVVGEASPNYLFHPAAPARARSVVPHARFIALLRNPVDRAYSHYQMRVRRGDEKLSFEEAIAREPERLAGTDDRASLAWRTNSYLTRGLYAEQLRAWLTVFPREQLLVLASEEFSARPERVLERVLAELGLRAWRPARFKPYHLSSYPDMAPATRRRLAAHFAPHNEQLYDLLDYRFGWNDD